jgi:16S rRNA (adenine1518-N6/adenine1519-N6)-dimethyltransferase
LIILHKSHYPKKSLGQNYLIDENICRNIVDSFKISENDFIIEIGSGKGEITKYILQFSKNVVAVEIDKNNAAHLNEKYPGLKLLNEDFLKSDLRKLIGSKINKIRIIGNIPYNITTNILFYLVDNRDIIKDAQIMMQEEVAQRIVASPGTKAYGILSVLLQVFCSPKLLFKVSRNCFYPKPNIDSRIVYFDFGKNQLEDISNIEFFRKFVRTSFGARRKTLRNTLKKLNIDTESTGIDFDFSERAERLDVKELIELSNDLYKYSIEEN